MTGNNFKEKKVVPLIFIQFWSRSHLNKLDLLTQQDVYYLLTFFYPIHRFEQQQAKITISKLKCEAYEDQSLKTIVGELNETIFDMKTSGEERMGEMETTLEEKFGTLENVVEKRLVKLENATFSAPIRCPTENSYFR